MKNQTSTKSKEISAEEQDAIDKINLEQSGVIEKESNKEKDSDTIVSEKEEKPKKQKNSGAVVREGMTNGNGAFIPFENGKLPDAYKEQTKDWKQYKKFSDGSIKF